MFDRQSLLFRDMQSRGVVKSADIERLRREHFPAGVGTEAESLALLAIDAACPVQDTAWAPFMAEMVGRFVVDRAQPQGYLTSGNARWLIGHTSNGGRVERRSCLDLVLYVLETARWFPPSLSVFALRQVELAVVTGRGPLRGSMSGGQGHVGRADVAVMRRILEAGGGAGSDAITRSEAEVLLDIHDATSKADNCLEWTELLTKTLANLVMTASGYAPPPRSAALQPDSGLDPATPAAAFLERMTVRGFRQVLGAYGRRSSEELALADLDHRKIEIITAESIARPEAAWLAMRIGRAADLAPAAQALLTYLRNEPRPLHPALAPLLEKAA